ncbi:hypothetical protein C8T65DRAFT_743007 [Cerioporus squamosus]|nr:hypothetical protein C8T65DRAFT_743007 [Cerioporus squamosus]
MPVPTRSSVVATSSSRHRQKPSWSRDATTATINNGSRLFSWAKKARELKESRTRASPAASRLQATSSSATRLEREGQELEVSGLRNATTTPATRRLRMSTVVAPVQTPDTRSRLSRTDSTAPIRSSTKRTIDVFGGDAAAASSTNDLTTTPTATGNTKGSTLDDRESAVRQRENALRQRETALGEREKTVTARENAATARESAAIVKENALREQQDIVQQRELVVQTREALEWSNKQLQEKNARLTRKLDMSGARYENAARELEAKLKAARDERDELVQMREAERRARVDVPVGSSNLQWVLAHLEDQFQCSLCFETMACPYSLNNGRCGHAFCAICILKWAFAALHRACGHWHEALECPLCRAPLPIISRSNPRNVYTFPFIPDRLGDTVIKSHLAVLQDAADFKAKSNTTNSDASRNGVRWHGEVDEQVLAWGLGKASRIQWEQRERIGKAEMTLLFENWSHYTEWHFVVLKDRLQAA